MEEYKLSEKARSALEMLFGKIKGNNFPDMMDTSNDKLDPITDHVENLFNVQYGKLTPQLVESKEPARCCCSTDTNYFKLSTRLKKSFNSPPDKQDAETSPNLHACNCNCPQAKGSKIQKILGGRQGNKLKISVRL